ncbi:MAG: HigA family addiction module antitoxin [Christensenellales bacterium]
MAEKLNGLSLDKLPYPGLTLKELLIERNMQQKELAARIGMKEQTISGIINGYDPITNETAVKLEIIFGIPASFWNTLQSNYYEQKLKIEMVESITEDEINLIDNKLYNLVVSMGYLPKLQNKRDRVIQFRNLLNIPSLFNSKQTLEACGLFRKNDTLKCDYLALAVWLKICELETKQIEVKSLNIDRIKENLNWIKSLSKKSPEEFIPLITKFFAECGVVLKVIKHLPNVPVQGYIEQKEDKVIICLTIRQSYADIFWFSLFHELGHLLKGNIKKRHLDFHNDQEEKTADVFASNTLISPATIKELINNGISEYSIRECANKNNVDIGIIVGRLQHDEIIGYSQFYNLRKRYKWA